MVDYDPSDFRVNGPKVLSAWIAAAIFVLAMAAALPNLQPEDPCIDEQVAFGAGDGPGSAEMPR